MLGYYLDYNLGKVVNATPLQQCKYLREIKERKKKQSKSVSEIISELS